MAAPVANPLNVFEGPDGLKKYYDPDAQPPLPLIELPEKLNPMRKDGVRIYAKLLTALPAQNVKALPSLNMLLNDPSAARKNIIEASSGSTISSMGITARVLYDNDDTTAFVSNKLSPARLRELQFLGLSVHLFGGPAYTSIDDDKGPVEWVRRQGRDPGGARVNPGQYDNEFNWRSHVRWTGPQIWRQLPKVDVFCMGLGSTGCVAGTGLYLKSQKPSVQVVGVCMREGEQIPGPRDWPTIQSAEFPWRGVTDGVEHVGAADAFRASMRLSREGIYAGPSSGMALEGLLAFLGKAKRAGTLGQMADHETGELSCVFVCCDYPQKHMGEYFTHLTDDADFKPIINADLMKVDQNYYDPRWELDPRHPDRHPPEIAAQVKRLSLLRKEQQQQQHEEEGDDDSATPALRTVDLRAASDFAAAHVAGSTSLPLPQLSAASKSPFDFDDPTELRAQYAQAEALAADPAAAAALGRDGPPLLLLCYNGDTSRMVAALLRGRGVEAYSFRDGMGALAEFLARPAAMAASSGGEANGGAE